VRPHGRRVAGGAGQVDGPGGHARRDPETNARLWRDDEIDKVRALPSSLYNQLNKHVTRINKDDAEDHDARKESSGATSGAEISAS
jgi:hypothetical protein